MTRKEKVAQMEPACVNEEFEAGVWGCPFLYSFLNLQEDDFRKCGKQFREGTLEDANCEACWNAEWKEQ